MRRFLIPVFFLCLLSIPSTSFAATLSVSPASGSYSVGDLITLKVVASSEAPLNAVSGVLSFPSSLFSIQSVSKGGSILNFWVTEPTFSTSAGTVKFEGVSLSGFQGSEGNVVIVTLRALKVGSGTVSFQSGQVLANDGQGTDITSGLSGGTFQVEAAKAKPTPSTPSPQPVEQPVSEAPTVSTLNAPVITLGTKEGVPAILGTSAYPKANVLLTFVPVEGSKLFITGVANGDGDFALAVPQALRNGPYAVSAVMVLSGGGQSDPSNVLTVEVGGVFAPDVSWQSATYSSMALIGILLVLLAYFLWRRYFGPHRNARTAIKKEVKEAEDMVHKSFTALKQDLTGRPNISELKKDLGEAEEYIEKEIKDIDAIHIDEKD